MSDRRALPAAQGLEGWLRGVAASGVDAVQVREKDLSDRALYEVLVAARPSVRPPVLLLVNGRPDLADAAGADGVHLPSTGLPVAAVRGHFPELLVGFSTHRPEEVARAARDGADYVTFGPVYPTPSKAVYGPPPGLDGLRRAVAAARGLPVLALGGVTAERLPEVAAAGAAGAAGIRLFLDPRRLGGLAEEARRLFQNEPVADRR